MQQFLSIGSSPFEEKCCQVGKQGYHEAAQWECTIYMRQLKRLFPDLRLAIKSFPHDFGVYYEVAAYYNNETEENAAFEAENNLPATWDSIALQEFAALEKRLITLITNARG